MSIHIKLVSPKSLKPGGVEYITWEVSGLTPEETLLDAQFSIDNCKTWNRARIERNLVKVLAAHPLALSSEEAIILHQPKTSFYIKVIKHPEAIIRGEYDIWLE